MEIKYADFLQKTSFTKEELLAISSGSLIIDPPDGEEGRFQLPAPPMLMFDRVIEIVKNGNKGRVVAEQDIALDDWFFQCHFRSDPVQPGCLGVDAIWQILGLCASVFGATGAGRALGCKEIEFFGQIRPHNKIVRYEIEICRFMKSSKASFIVGTGTVFVDNESVYTIKEAKVGIFKGIQYNDFPRKSKYSLGGKMEKN